MGHCLRILTIDVEYGASKHARDVGAVAGRAAIARHRREADLVVDHDVDRASGAIGIQFAQIQCLGNNALAGKGSVSVYK